MRGVVLAWLGLAWGVHLRVRRLCSGVDFTGSTFRVLHWVSSMEASVEIDRPVRLTRVPDEQTLLFSVAPLASINTDTGRRH